MEPDVFVRVTLGGPLKPWPGTGGPGLYGPEVCCGVKDVCNGLLYCWGCESCTAAPTRPVPSAASSGGGVFSRWAIGSGAAGAAGL